MRLRKLMGGNFIHYCDFSHDSRGRGDFRISRIFKVIMLCMRKIKKGKTIRDFTSGKSFWSFLLFI